MLTFPSLLKLLGCQDGMEKHPLAQTDGQRALSRCGSWARVSST